MLRFELRWPILCSLEQTEILVLWYLYGTPRQFQEYHDFTAANVLNDYTYKKYGTIGHDIMVFWDGTMVYWNLKPW